MIAADTSAWIDYSDGNATAGARRLELCLENGNLVMPVPVVFEILSSPTLTTRGAELISTLPQLELLDGYWERGARLRRELLKHGRRARSMECLIAQNCMDHQIPLITSDTDFRHFTDYGLSLA